MIYFLKWLWYDREKGGVILELFHYIHTHQQKYLDFLCKICSYEARAYEKDVINSMADYISDFAEGEGFHVTRTPMETCGDFLTIDINQSAPKGCLFLAHMDTVHKPGAFGQNPVQICDDRIIAPGAIDCKGGIAIALLCMKALVAEGYDKHLRLILTSDEEVSNILGGEQEIRFFHDSAAGFPYAMNCETSEKDEVVISRKGILKYRLDISGVGGHSGIHYFECKNPIAEAAHKIIALENSSRPNGITYSCNIIQGGTLPNIIPGQCSVTVDVRVPKHSDIQIAEATVKEIAETEFIPGTSTAITRISMRPPMEKNDQTTALFQELLSVCHRYDLGSLTPVESGGGSDSCYTQAAGVPSICGMGGCGEFCHTNKEYISIDSVPLRAKILAVFLKDREK